MASSSSVSSDEKLAIATHFLLSSPPGEIREILTDVKVCLGSSASTILSDSVLKGIFRRYNQAQNQVIEFSDGAGNVVISEDNEVDAAHYVDSNSKKSIEIDHVGQVQAKGSDLEAAPASMISPSAAMEGLLNQINKAVHDYVDVQYVGGVAQLTGCSVLPAKGGKDGEIIIHLSAQKTNLRNYWSGKWRSEWRVKTAEKKIGGLVRVMAHYFEDGNVQMDTRKDLPDEPYTGDDVGLAVKNFISKHEQMIQNTLEEMYINMAQETFKDMRRVLPLTKTKMDWTGAQLKLASAFGTDGKKN